MRAHVLPCTGCTNVPPPSPDPHPASAAASTKTCWACDTSIWPCSAPRVSEHAGRLAAGARPARAASPAPRRAHSAATPPPRARSPRWPASPPHGPTPLPCLPRSRAQLPGRCRPPAARLPPGRRLWFAQVPARAAGGDQRAGGGARQVRWVEACTPARQQHAWACAAGLVQAGCTAAAARGTCLLPSHSPGPYCTPSHPLPCPQAAAAVATRRLRRRAPPGRQPGAPARLAAGAGARCGGGHGTERDGAGGAAGAHAGGCARAAPSVPAPLLFRRAAGGQVRLRGA